MTAGTEEAKPRIGVDEFGEYRIDDTVWTMNEIRDHPLFMEDMPSDISDNPHLLGLQSLMYDDKTPEECAEHFRQLGNEAFKMSKNSVATKNALLAYTRGLEMECSDKVLISQLHSNRAAVSMRMGEQDRAVDDCRQAIKADPNNVKAYFRAAKASQELGLTQQALEFCAEAARVAPQDAEVRKLHTFLKSCLEKESATRQEERRAMEAAASATSSTDAAVKAALEGRGVMLGPPLFDLAMYEVRCRVKPAFVDEPGGAVQWPLMFLYDEVNQSDFVEAFDERCCLSEQLQLMFPEDRRVEWDEEGKYVWNRLAVYLEVYLEGSRTKMVRVAAGEPLEAALAGLRVPVCMPIHVLVDNSPAHDVFRQTNEVQEAVR